MKKFSAYLLLVSLLFSLCSCAYSKQEEQKPDVPESIPEAESIVEPVSDGEKPAVIAPEPDNAAASGDEADTPSPKTDEPVIAAPESESLTENKNSTAEIYGAVARSSRLDGEAIEKELLRLINTLRDEDGVNSLGIEDSMQFAARIRAAEALESFSHTRPDGMTYNTAFDEAGFSYAGKWHGENLSSLTFSEGMFDENEIALEMFKGLRNSPGHYRNMTEVNFVQAGVGVAIFYSGDTVDVASAQMFSSL